jgi:Initiator Replication protein
MCSTLVFRNIDPVSLEPILIGGEKLLKPALRVISVYRLRIDEIRADTVVTSFTRWLEAVQTRGTENQEVYLTFSRQFERIWLESKKRLLDYMEQKPANIGLRSQYALRLYDWAQKYVTAGIKCID